MAAAVMFFFAVLSGAVFGMAQMSAAYYSFFERRSVLEQATLTFAGSLAETVRDNAADWWSGGSAPASGDYTVSVTADAPAMRFTYVISPDGNKIYKLFVRGEYAGRAYSDPNAEPIACGVSVDISTAASSADAWSKIVRM
jgi:hypothetical protein